jgi:hypothetical protein
MGSYDKGGYSLGMGYIDPSDSQAKDLKQMKDWFYNANYTGASAVWMAGAIDKRFKIGDSTLYSAAYGQNYQQYQRFFFNLIRRHGNMISGFQRKNRKSTITIPNQVDTDNLCDDYNKCIRWCEDRDNFQEYFSESFENGADVGINWLWMYMDYTNDAVSGDIFTDSVAFTNVLWDQNFRKQDLTDCNGVWRRRWVSKNAAMVLVPGYADEIKKMRPAGAKDGRFPLQAELQNVHLNNLFTYDEFYYRSTRTAKVIIDPYTGESAEWEEDEENADDMLRMIMQQQPWLKVVKKEIPTVKLCLSIGDREIYHGQNLLSTEKKFVDEYPCVPHLCYHEPDILSYSGRIMGYIRNTRDCQFLYNMRKVIELQIMQSQINAGWIYPIDAVVDPKAFRQASGGDAFLIPLKAGHLANEIQRIEPSAIPQSLIELSRGLAEDITKITGVNEELLGMAEDDKSGILSMLRQSAGLVTLQNIFDRSDLTQRLYGSLRMKAIRANFSKGKIRNILGHDADPRFFLNFSQKYGISVEEGNYSTTQRQTELQQLLHFKQLGMNIPDTSIMRAAFITNKKEIMEEMQQANQQQQQQQEQQMQSQMQMDQGKMLLDHAKTKSELAREKELMASASEKYSKIADNMADAERKQVASDIDLVRAHVDLENLDLENMRNSLELIEYIKQTTQQPQAAEVGV